MRTGDLTGTSCLKSHDHDKYRPPFIPSFIHGIGATAARWCCLRLPRPQFGPLPGPLHSLGHSGRCMGRHYGSHCLQVETTSGQGSLPLLVGTATQRVMEGPPMSMWQLSRPGEGLLCVALGRWIRRWSNGELREPALECVESVAMKSVNWSKLQW